MFDAKTNEIFNAEILDRVYAGDKLGAREQEIPEFEDESFDKGSRENGGFWWALNGPVIMRVAQFDKVESSLILAEGLPDQSESYSNIPVYCAHPHAWILYCYFILNTSESICSFCHTRLGTKTMTIEKRECHKTIN